MHTLCLGLNHTTAPLKLREQFSLDENGIRSALARLSCGHISTSIAELIIISTCNRIELYAASSKLAFAELEAFLSEVSGVKAEHFHTHTYRFMDMEVVRHLFEVSAGLDSLVVGEPQILGQVTRALELSRGQNAAGPLLNRLFQSAIHAGKRARTETGISRNPASVSSLAASLAERVVHPIAKAQVVILGAGEMAELTVEALRKRGVGKIRVINRTLERAREMAKRWGAESATFEFLQKALCDADILIASTGAPHTLVDTQMVQQAMRTRPHRPLALIDIAVPRDIDPAAADIHGVRLYDMDTLNAQLEHSLAERVAEVPQVKAILEEELSQFAEYLKSLEMLPLIVDMRQQAESIRQAELEKTLRRMPDLTDAERIRIEALTEALVNKLLDAPVRRLRAEAACPHAPEYATVARTLFGLKPESRLCTLSGEACPIPTAAD